MFDCFGAGQQVTQVTFGGRAGGRTPALAAAQFAVLPVMRQLHEILWYLAEALTLPRRGSAARRDPDGAARTEDLTAGTAEELAALDVGAYRRRGRGTAGAGQRPRPRSGRRPTGAAPT